MVKKYISYVPSIATYKGQDIHRFIQDELYRIANTIGFSVPAHAQLSSTSNQVPANTNETLITFNNDDSIENMTHSSGVVTLQVSGKYYLVYGAQVAKASGSTAVTLDMWLKVNDVNVARTGVKSIITNTDDSGVLILNYVGKLNKGDTIKAYMKVDATAGSPGLYYTAASSPVPDVPSIIASISKVGDYNE